MGVVAGRRLHRVGAHPGQVRRIDPGPRMCGIALPPSLWSNGARIVNGSVQPATCLKFGRERLACRLGSGHDTAVRLEVGAFELNYPRAPGD
jgi:hypothetical protein